MPLPIIAPVILAELGGLIKLITWLGSLVYVGGYVRDIYTKSKEAEIQLSNNETVDDIIGNPNLTPEQKTELLRKYLEEIKDKDKPTDWGNIALILGAAVIAAMLLPQLIGGKK